ncbi:MAG: SAM-dependent methyltransferase [Paracoccaceae bacterium]|jgi:SAM-dependent methyltransferase
MNIDSAWTRQVESGQQPDSADLQDHLAAVHDNNAGFTETCAWNCRDAAGKNSYQLLADIVDPERHSSVLDLACGSGVLLDLCHQRFGTELALSGMDMSDAELRLANERLADTDIKLHQGMAQDLNFIADASVDVILCHWALTLMDPVAPVLATIKRVLRENGVFAAIIDGDTETAPGYREVHDIIYACARREYPDYGAIELGDPRVRTAAALQELAANTFVGADIDITPAVLSLDAAPDILAREAAGFFYASFVLSAAGHRQMLIELERHFEAYLQDGASCFTLPVNRLVVRQNPRAMHTH